MKESKSHRSGKNPFLKTVKRLRLITGPAALFLASPSDGSLKASPKGGVPEHRKQNQRLHRPHAVFSLTENTRKENRQIFFAIEEGPNKPLPV